MRKAGAPVGNTRDRAGEKIFRYAEGVGVDPATAGVGEKAANLRAEGYGVPGGKNFVANLTPSMYEAPFDVTTRARSAGETFDSFNKKYALGSIACIEGHVQPKSIGRVN